MISKYDRYSKDELIRIIEERDRKPRLAPSHALERPGAGGLIGTTKNPLQSKK